MGDLKFNAKNPGGSNPPDSVHAPSLAVFSIDYPRLADQPDYIAEFEKFTRFTAERQATAKSLEALKLELQQCKNGDDEKENNAISNAESLLVGAVPYSLQSEIDKATKLVQALDAAIQVQRGVLSRVESTLSRAAGRRYSEEHKQIVRRMMAAVDELHAANLAEKTLRNDLERLGYNGFSVPPMTLISAEDPSDKNGNIAHYWYREAATYVRPDAELAAAVRKARVQAVTEGTV